MSEKEHPEIHRSNVEIPLQLLCDLLDFPTGTKIHRIKQSFSSGNIQIIVEHDDLPEHREGEYIPMVTPEYTDENLGGIFRPQFKNWGTSETLSGIITSGMIDSRGIIPQYTPLK